jgi:hypothetical protein
MMNFSLCSFLHCSVTSSILGPNIVILVTFGMRHAIVVLRHSCAVYLLTNEICIRVCVGCRMCIHLGVVLLILSLELGLFAIRINLELFILQSVGLLGRGISPIARPLPTQDDTNTEETRTDFQSSSRIRTHDPNV